ncbi:MAG: protoporphyrinogen oxidase [Planctomycetota bacterium]|nr:MAG: protoporphyrinogen oxidase [Planctomycetota bacterium]REJ95713.1 MAG: protoporphyrinogen oxidase [Planctomycetota bacterium]REK23415.1 MAG: protoporphyrinogen oxidase [Planctomycetota bacterium]REK38948.1 MAG: protoporphyrinogen oxidase [Planctomycetota bacterium]
MTAPSETPAPTSRPPRIAVVGGGITGLAAAHRIVELATESNRPVEVTLIEASQRLGGVFGTRRIGGYTIETGADSFITDKPWAVDLCRRLGLESSLIGVDPEYRRALILYRGRPVPAPEGLNLMAPSRLGPILRTPLLSPLGKARLGLEWLVPRRRSREDESLASFVRRRLGRQMLDRIVQPMIGGIYTADPEKLSLSATLPRFVEMEREHGSLTRAALRNRRSRPSQTEDASGARYGMFASLAEGMSQLPGALAERIRSTGEIRLGHAVTTVEPAERVSDRSPSKSFRIRLADDSQVAADAVILAVPAYRAADLIDAWEGQLAEALREIEYASSAIVVTGHRLADIGHPLDAAGLVVPYIEGRSLLAVSFLSRKFAGRAPEGCVVLRTFVGGAMHPEVLERSDDELTSLVLSELGEILGVTGRPDVSTVVRYHRAMPQYHVGHQARVAAIDRIASRHPRLALAGNAYHGVGLPDCIHSGQSAAVRMWEAVHNGDLTEAMRGPAP